MAIAISIIEDDRLTRESLSAVIAHSPDLHLLHTYSDAEKAIADITRHLPAVLLVDINLPGMNGIECVRRLKVLHPGLQVLMLTTYEDTDNIFQSLRAGASGYLLKRHPPEALVEAIRDVHRGGSPMSPNIARKVVSHFQSISSPSASGIEKLTPRESEILALLAQGLHYKEIAATLGITAGTVGVHLHKIYEKLHVQSRTEAVVKFLKK